jgi:hypothetical protein
VSATRRQAGPAFRPDEFLETFLRMRRGSSRSNAREVSIGQRRRVELYGERRAQAAAVVRAKAA